MVPRRVKDSFEEGYKSGVSVWTVGRSSEECIAGNHAVGMPI